MAPAPYESLHLLSIDLGSAPSTLRAALALGHEGVDHWLRRARAAGAPLAIVCGPDSVDLYSTAAEHRTAFKPLLESLWSLGRNVDGLQQVIAREARGDAAARHLLRQAAGLASTEHGQSYSSCIAAAFAAAERQGTLSSPLTELFELAGWTADRSELETELSAPHSTRASRQIEALSAERIVEEELTALRVAAANDPSRRSSAPPSSQAKSSLSPLSGVFGGERASLPPYSSNEPSSCVRMRVAPFRLVPEGRAKSG